MPAQRIKELDVLRGIAALAVVLYHYTCNFNVVFPKSTYAAPVVLSHFNLGVELFFIISGYVIFMTIDRNSNPLHFVVSRFSRLYPAYWVSVLLACGLVNMFQVTELQVSFKDFLWNLTMFQAMPAVHAAQAQPIYWTLGAELCFYFFVLAGLITGLYRRPLWVIPCAMLLMIAVNLVYIHHGLPYYMPVYRYLLLYNNLPLFCTGVLMYLLKKGSNMIWVSLNIILCLLAYILVKDVASIVAVCLFTGIFLLQYKGWLSRIVNPVTVFWGSISYSLYLMHQYLGYILILKLSNYGLNSTLTLSITLCIAILAATIVTYAVEKPAMKAIRRWLQ